ncbi:hypothetical protein YK48G_06500 [Lentilactobacillus fungorum]|uniref:DUF1656 domain-containing protein n=1 Tax=Lentilactobacillus fungorum TaxID=2201250 RepID=A0ABQ3VWF0_9LACO|nr:hypothetical protein [Lentilactobacillus fungorum]GHP13225.1 hypothetical protein YK48G_06500 [Lentilactobacillus fungorum]
MVWLYGLVAVGSALLVTLIKIRFDLKRFSIKGYFPFLIVSSAICLTAYVIEELQQMMG